MRGRRKRGRKRHRGNGDRERENKEMGRRKRKGVKGADLKKLGRGDLGRRNMHAEEKRKR
jgi:hypothetical protein